MIQMLKSYTQSIEIELGADHMMGNPGADTSGFVVGLLNYIDSIIREPKPYVSTERPDFKLVNGFQGGIYHYKATIDPGEDGEVYLKAYEVTKDYRLSATRMKQATLEKVTGKGPMLLGGSLRFMKVIGITITLRASRFGSSRQRVVRNASSRRRCSE